MTSKLAAFVFLLAFALPFAPAPAPAQQQTSDDTKWITQCVSDNKDEGQSAR